MPVREARAFRGHAVRAVYLACGAVDVAVETGDRELLDAIVAQWERTVAARTYITGGMGSRHSARGLRRGLRAAARPRVLGDVRRDRVGDAVLAAAAGHGRGALRRPGRAHALQRRRRPRRRSTGAAFFYANPLHQRVPGEPPARDAVSPRASSSMRAPWFNVACCPTNIGPHAREPRRLRGDGRRARRADPPVRPGDDHGRDVRPARRDRLSVVGRGRRRASTRAMTGRARSPCACPRGPRARRSTAGRCEPGYAHRRAGLAGG